jgi:hypothetical protein
VAHWFGIILYVTRHQIGQKPLACLGIDLQRPVDRTSPGKWPYIENVVGTVDGTVTPRPGLGTSALANAPANETPWHSIRTLNDPTGGSGVWCRYHGIGDRLCSELSSAVGTINNLLGGFSGNPLSMVQARPTESPQPYMYVADSLLMRKGDRSGTLKQIGLPAPPAPPTALVSSARYKEIDLFRATTGWAQGGTATAPALLSAGPGRPVNTTTPASNGFVKDTASGLTCIAPTAMTNIVVGMVLDIIDTDLSTNSVLVEEVRSGAPAIAITRIIYDSGTTGLCSMMLTIPNANIQVNSVLLVTGVATAGTELIRVVDVLIADDGTMCVRAATTVARLPTDTLTAKPSFTCHMAGTPLGTGAIQDNGILSTSPSSTGSTPATLSKVAALDLSFLNSTLIGSTLDDYMSIGLRVADQTTLTEIRIMLDCASDSVSAGAFTGTEFTKEYFVKVITASDLAALIAFQQTALANRQDQIQIRATEGTDRVTRVTDRQFDDNPSGGRRLAGGGPFVREVPNDIGQPGYNTPTNLDTTRDPGAPVILPRDQLKPGIQFCTARWRLSEMQRVGTSDRGWKDIVGIRVAWIATGAVLINLLDWVVAGGYDTEVSDIDEGYTYRYRGRDSTTGVVSNASPESLGPVRPQRQTVLLTLTQHSAAEVDKLDIERRGGSVDGWHRIATIPNSASPTYTDRIGNSVARAAFETEPSGLTDCQPWPLVQKPQTTGAGTVTISGSLIRDTAAPFSTSLLRGIPVIANGKFSTLRRVLSTSIIEVDRNVGDSAAGTWELPRPVLAGQPLPILIGGNWDQNRLIGLGDPNDPSAYYLTRRGNFDATYELLRFEIPGAILQNGCMYNGSPYLWSTEHMYRIDDAGVDAFGNPLFRAVIVPGARGLIARWACCAADRMFWLDREGICASDGGAPEILTDDDLYPLFPHSGTSTQGVAVNGINPPNLALAQEPNLRLSQGADRLRFLYIDSGGSRRELEYRMRPGDAPNGWFPHQYTPGIACAYYEEGPGKHSWLMGGADTTTANLYQLVETQSDGGSAIVWAALPQYENVGDPRKRKRWGDYTTEVDRDSSTVNVTPQFDNGATALTLVAYTTLTGRAIRIGDLNSSGVVAGSGVLATNMSLLFGGSVTTQRPKLYTWEPTWIDRPEVTQLRATDFEDAEPSGPKFVRGVWLSFDSLGSTRAASIYRDGNLTTAAVTITGINSASGPKRQFFAFATPFYASTLLVLPTDSASWMLFEVAWEADSAPESSDGPQAWSDLGYAGAKWIQGVIVDCDTENATVNLVVEGDENSTLATITSVNHNGRAQKVYTFNPPILTHLVRINPSAAIRLWPTPPTRWVWEPEPEIAKHYETQQTTHDLPELFKIMRDCQITLRSTSIVTFSIYDGSLGTGSTALFSTTIPSTAGLRKTVYVPLAAIKAKSLIYVLTSSVGFALYRRDTWLRVRGWGRTVTVLGGESAASWQTVAPFGSDSRVNGALV